MSAQVYDEVRTRPVTIGDAVVGDGSFTFAWADVRRVDFMSAVPVSLYGLRLSASGSITVHPDRFDHLTVDIKTMTPGAEQADWLSQGDRLADGYFRTYETSMTRAIGQAWSSLVADKRAPVCNAMLTKLDDLALEKIAYVEGWEERAGGRALNIAERLYRPDFPSEMWRQIEAVDEAPLRHHALLSTLPVYIVHLDRRPLLQPIRWGRMASGLLGRACALRYSDGRSLLGCIGRIDATITRCRLMDGNLYEAVAGGGLRPIDFDFERAIHTTSAESMERAP